MDNLLLKKIGSLVPPYPPTPFPHASGGKGEQGEDLLKINRQFFQTRFGDLGNLVCKLLLAYSPFPSACVGERAGVRGAVNLRSTIGLLLLLALSLTACQSTNPPPGPTIIPTLTVTVAPSLTLPPSATISDLPQPSLAPIVTATSNAPAATNAPVALAPTDPPTPAPYCYVAKQGDTFVSLISKAGYADLSVWAETCALNNQPPNCTNVQAGKQYCVPHQTWTPSPEGYPLTQTAQASAIANILPTSSSSAYYTVVDGDNITSVVYKTNTSLRTLCAMNNPDPINCAGCNLDGPLGHWGCAPRLVVGAKIKYPGPPPSPTITPTLTGSETATPTPPYPPPQLVSPTNGSSVSGLAQLVWLPAGILLPGEEYLVLVTDASTGVTREFYTEATSVRLPANMQPPSGQTHTVNWRVSVARQGDNGTYIIIGDPSVINSFSWQGG